MENNYRCWKLVQDGDAGEQKILRIDEDTYALRSATGEEIRLGTDRLCKWYVERKYKTQQSGGGLERPIYPMHSEIQKITFEELIFKGDECIGVYHDELIFLFDDEKTHYQEKYLGEMKISADQGIDFYDYYYLHSN